MKQPMFEKRTAG